MGMAVQSRIVIDTKGSVLTLIGGVERVHAESRK